MRCCGEDSTPHRSVIDSTALKDTVKDTLVDNCLLQRKRREGECVVSTKRKFDNMRKYSVFYVSFVALHETLL